LSIEQMRTEVMNAYPGDKWKYRVNRMGEDQIIAVYHRLSQTGKLEEVREQKAYKPPRQEQIMFDFMKG